MTERILRVARRKLLQFDIIWMNSPNHSNTSRCKKQSRIVICWCSSAFEWMKVWVENVPCRIFECIFQFNTTTSLGKWNIKLEAIKWNGAETRLRLFVLCFIWWINGEQSPFSQVSRICLHEGFVARMECIYFTVIVYSLSPCHRKFYKIHILILLK